MAWEHVALVSPEDLRDAQDRRPLESEVRFNTVPTVGFHYSGEALAYTRGLFQIPLPKVNFAESSMECLLIMTPKLNKKS